MSNDSLNTQIDVLRSRALAEQVAQALRLDDDRRFLAAMGIADPPGQPRGPQRRALVVSLLQANLAVDLPRSSRVASISFTSTEPEQSARIANAFAEQFIQANLQRRFDSSAYARDFVAGQLEGARRALERSERQLNAYARGAGLIRTRDALSREAPVDAGGSVTTTSLLQLNDAAIRARAARIEEEARWQAMQGAPLLSSAAELANPTVQALMTRRAAAQAELETARARYLPDHPAIGRLIGELSAVEGQLQSAAQQARRAVRTQYEAAVRAEEQLTGEVGALRGQTLAEQDRSVGYNTLARQADTARSIYEGLLQRYRELNASAGIASSNIAIIDRAFAPSAPSAPSLARNLAGALLAGFVLAAGAVFLRDQFDDAVHLPEDVEDKLDLPLLGVVPRVVGDDPLAALANPRSPVTEAFNALRGSLLYATARGLPRILAITSAQPGEGKSTTAIALATGLARLDLKVLLIDADLRRPALHRLAAQDNGAGLTDLLTTGMPLAEAIRRGVSGGFDLVTSGPLPLSPSELLATPRLAQLLEECAGLYDAVLIDSPPILGLADAPTLAALVDATLLVVEADRGRAGHLKAALQRLRAVQPVLLGAVLTKFDPTKAANRYSSYSGYDYYAYGAADAEPQRAAPG